MHGESSDVMFQQIDVSVKDHHSDHALLLNSMDDDEEEVLFEQATTSHSMPQSIELRSRARNVDRPSKKSTMYKDNPEESPFVLVECQVQPGDTIQKVCLRYAITMSDLLRANNLHRDQEFYALKTVKVPVSRFSALAAAAKADPLVPVDELVQLQDGTVVNAASHVRGGDDLPADRASIVSSDGETVNGKLAKMLQRVDNNVRVQEATLAGLSEAQDGEAFTGDLHFYAASQPHRSILERTDVAMYAVLILCLFVVLPTAIWYKLYWLTEEEYEAKHRHH